MEASEGMVTEVAEEATLGVTSVARRQSEVDTPVGSGAAGPPRRIRTTPHGRQLSAEDGMGVGVGGGGESGGSSGGGLSDCGSSVSGEELEGIALGPSDAEAAAAAAAVASAARAPDGSAEGSPPWARRSFTSALSSASGSSVSAGGGAAGSAPASAPPPAPLPNTCATAVVVARRRPPPLSLPFGSLSFSSLPSLGSLSVHSGKGGGGGGGDGGKGSGAGGGGKGSGGVGAAAVADPTKVSSSSGGGGSSGELRRGRQSQSAVGSRCGGRSWPGAAGGGNAGVPPGALPRRQGAGVAVRAGLLHSLRGIGSLDRHAVVLRPAEDFAAVVVSRGYGPAGAAAAATAAAVLMGAVQRHLRLPPRRAQVGAGATTAAAATAAPSTLPRPGGASPRAGSGTRSGAAAGGLPSLTTSTTAVSTAVHSSFVDASMAVDALPGSASSGASATLVVIRGGHVTVGNVGTITCFLATPPAASSPAGTPHTVHTLSTAHTPRCPIERERIAAAGGRTRRGHVLAGPGGAAVGVSRLLGASNLRSGGVIQLPDVASVPVSRAAAAAGGGVRVVVVAADVECWVGVADGNVTGCLGRVLSAAAGDRIADGVRAAADGVGELVWGAGGQVDDATVAVLHSRW
ncbi:hypothetical protein MMPV_000183 [Pyropia vietnamensis]